MEKTIHHGRNVKRFREVFGLKQEGLAYELGDDWNQQKISLLEQKQTIDDGLLGEVAKILKVPMQALKHFDADEAITFITSSYDSSVQTVNNNPSFHTDAKLEEALEENKKLQAEINALHKALLQEKDEKIALMERLLNK